MKRTIATLAVALLMLALPATSVDATTDDRELLVEILEHYAPRLTAFTVQPIDRDALLADAEDGKAILVLQGKPYILAVEEYFLKRPGSVPLIVNEDGEEVVDPNYSFESRFFRGAVADAPGSRVLLTFTQIGVAGYVREDQWIHFEALKQYFPEAGELHLVYDHAALTMTEEIDEEDPVPVEDPLSAPIPPITIQAATTPGVYTRGDSQLYNAFSCWSCKIDNVMATVDDIYDQNFAWSVFIDVQIACTTTTCDTTHGTSSTDSVTLRSEFATKAKERRDTDGATWGMAHLFSGKDFDGSTIGRAYLAGRYGVNQIKDGTGTYDGGSIDYEGGLLVAHEMGHNFRGEHPDATSYDHCHASFGWCWDNSVHYTVMYTPFSHQPSTDNEMVGDFSSTNINDMNACNDGTWAALSFTPGSYGCS